MSPPPTELTVLMPCLNEAETLQVCIEKAQSSMAALDIVGEVVIADNGSEDGSRDIARAAGACVVDVPKRGYGAALRAGIEAARGRYVIMADADDSYALDDLGPFVAELRNGSDLVMGNRFKGGIAPGAMPPLHRYIGNPVLSWLGRRFFHVSIGDFHCGMRGFDRDKILALGLRTSGMEFASEMVVRASLNHLRITEVPTTLKPDGRSRSPHLRTWSDGWRHLRFLMAFSPRWSFLYPALVLTLLGLIGTARLLVGPIRIGKVAFDVQTMLVSATLLIIGIQIAGLALVSRAYAAHLGLLPHSPRLDRLLDRIALERGILIGAGLVIAGVVAFVVALAHWHSQDFGTMATSDVRIPLAGMVLMVAGVQTVLVSFTLSLTKIGEA